MNCDIACLVQTLGEDFDSSLSIVLQQQELADDRTTQLPAFCLPELLLGPLLRREKVGLLDQDRAECSSVLLLIMREDTNHRRFDAFAARLYVRSRKRRLAGC
jgi:hypothetical protein